VDSGDSFLQLRLPAPITAEVLIMRIANCLALAAVLTLAQAAVAADEPYTGQPQVEKPGRAAEGDTVKSAGPATRPGRTAEEDPQSVMSDRDRPGHAIDDSTVKTGGNAQRPGRQAEEK
jgi:hypothetical protein